MPGIVLTALGAIVLVLIVLAAGFVIGMRRKSGVVQGPVIWMGKRFFNGVGMQTAGTPGAASGIVRHRGRTSGAMYETPVGVAATDEAFLIALPYGTRSNWLRNVLANGEATLVHEGETYAVDHPEIVPMAGVEAAFPAGAQRMQRIFGVNEALRLHRAGQVSAAA